MLEIGFGKVNITPRVGVEMSGFGPYIHRYATCVHDPLFARAMAVRQERRTVVIVSCDLIELEAPVTEEVRRLVFAEVGVPADAVMVNHTHTHSGPAVCPSLMGWGEIDQPYLQLLPRRIAAACIAAVRDLAPGTLRHAEVPCEGLGYNREYDMESGNAPDVLEDTWRPRKPELTDTTCHVVTAHRGEKLAGLFTYFSCHPVVCCAQTRKLHGDFCGVAMNKLERENPGVTALFLQGALGNVNTGFVHQPEEASYTALAVFAERFARSVRNGIGAARAIDVDAVRYMLTQKTFSRRNVTLEKLEADRDKHLAVLHAADADDSGRDFRMSTLLAARFGQLADAMRRGDAMTPTTQLQGFRIGPVALLATPLEVFQAIKNDIVAEAVSPIPLVLSVTNDAAGYAPDHHVAAAGENYTAWTIPIVFGTLPYADIHTELRDAVVRVDEALQHCD